MAKGNPKKRKELKKAWETYKRRRDKAGEEYQARVDAINAKYAKGGDRA